MQAASTGLQYAQVTSRYSGCGCARLVPSAYIRLQGAGGHPPPYSLPDFCPHCYDCSTRIHTYRTAPRLPWVDPGRNRDRHVTGYNVSLSPPFLTLATNNMSLGCSLYGTAVVQTYLYIKNYPHDRRWIKAVVGTVWCAVLSIFLACCLIVVQLV
jgi:hypothetical protein